MAIKFFGSMEERYRESKKGRERVETDRDRQTEKKGKRAEESNISRGGTKMLAIH